jgi:hypothetical protein
MSELAESDAIVATDAAFNVMTSFKMDNRTALYTLSVQTPAPISFVILRSELDIGLAETEGQNAIACQTRPEGGAGGLLATYRCPSGEAMSRIEIRVRTVEGRSGKLVSAANFLSVIIAVLPG